MIELGCIAFALIGALPGLAQAQKYPVKPVRMVIGFPPGGGEDFHARTVAQNLLAKRVRSDLPRFAEIARIAGARVE